LSFSNRAKGKWRAGFEERFNFAAYNYLQKYRSPSITSSTENSREKLPDIQHWLSGDWILVLLKL
jgi:hypothetical protein